jgi:hypothetical protein
MSDEGPEDAAEDDGERPDERDPFGRLEEGVGDRDGDPFEYLSEDTAEEARRDVGEEGGAMPGEFEEVAEPSVQPTDPETEPDDPFSEAGPDFAELDLGDVDEDEVWAALSAAQARGSVADVRDRTYAEVSKHRFCEACEYFTGPPRADCTHEGTDILEFVDMETVRVVDCPIVAERRELQEEG